jgi:hypothetical protein
MLEKCLKNAWEVLEKCLRSAREMRRKISINAREMLEKFSRNAREMLKKLSITNKVFKKTFTCQVKTKYGKKGPGESHLKVPKLLLIQCSYNFKNTCFSEMVAFLTRTFEKLWNKLIL